MNTYSTSSNKGFTLLEILLVIAAIGILAAIVLVAINPNRQLAQARNAQRRSDVQTILNAIYQKIIDEGASGSTVAQSAVPTTAGEINRNNTTGTTSCTGTPVNMSSVASDAAADIVPNYVASIPQDPSEPGTSNCSGYSIVRDSATQRITVTALNTELIGQSGGPTANFSVTR
jgi:prepilin-type N-terminal cleavage/methylation domain-containing protein